MQPRPASSDPAHRKHAVLLIDEEGLLRDALCALLNEQQDYMALGAACGAGLAELALATDPEIVMMEFALHEGRGPEVVRVVRERWPQARILVLTHRRDDIPIEAA